MGGIRVAEIEGDVGNRLAVFLQLDRGVVKQDVVEQLLEGHPPGGEIALHGSHIHRERFRYRGRSQEKIYDVAWSGNRRPDANGRVPAVGSTVDVENATWTNTIGAPELIAVWEDPDFDPGQRAFYYLRVLEIPTPRWTAYDAKYYGLDLADDVTVTLQERAYTAPIWYTPAD